MGNQIAQHQFLFVEVEDPQTAFGGWLRIVDDRQMAGRFRTVVDRALHGVQRTFQRLGIEFWRGVREAGVENRRWFAGGKNWTGHDESGGSQQKSAQKRQHFIKCPHLLLIWHFGS
ncbi:hypothetical protein D3C81_1090500 [compost metagenome]